MVIVTYTDESGQDTKGRWFIVATVVLSNDRVEPMRKQLLSLETDTRKLRKWSDTDNKTRRKYIAALIKQKITSSLVVFFSTYSNKNDYVSLIAAHIAKTVVTSAGNNSYKAKIFIDKSNNATENLIKKELKKFRINYDKIRGITEQSDPFIRLADAVCGVIRDLENKKVPAEYKTFYRKTKPI